VCITDNPDAEPFFDVEADAAREVRRIRTVLRAKIERAAIARMGRNESIQRDSRELRGERPAGYLEQWHRRSTECVGGEVHTAFSPITA
jgi:hypothetical protein